VPDAIAGPPPSIAGLFSLDGAQSKRTRINMQSEEDKEPITETPIDDQSSDADVLPVMPPGENKRIAGTLALQQLAGAPCPTCGSALEQRGSSFVYVIGIVEKLFRPDLKREYDRVVARRSDTAKLTDRQMLHLVLSKPENMYITRQIDYLMSVQNTAAYILRPRETDLHLLVEADDGSGPEPRFSLVIGVLGPLVSLDYTGLVLPTVLCDYIGYFRWDDLAKSIPRPAGAKSKDFIASASQVFRQLTNNAGQLDEHRAANVIAVTYKEVYTKAAEKFAANAALSKVEVRPSALSGDLQKRMDVFFTFVDRKTGVPEKWVVGVDMGEFPSVVVPLQLTFEH
jgi:hypothetical protein